MADDFYGKIIKEVRGLHVGSDEVRIVFEDDSYFWMLHFQDCCEYVRLIDIDGGNEFSIVGAEWRGYEVSSDDSSAGGTWTFYRLYTSVGMLWLRWLGESNGYYSERVSHGYAKEDENPSYW